MPDTPSELSILQQLASALAMGLLIGLERGWRILIGLMAPVAVALIVF